jgi:hypothetical protein
MLVDDFIAFLGSFKNTESLSGDLRRAIQVPTEVDEHVVGALLNGHNVLITGSAGSGKTHTLQTALSLVPGSTHCVPHGESPRSPHISYVEDATELTPQERLAVIAGKSRHRQASAMAINEGPLREAAELKGGSVLAKAVDRLHSAQRGVTTSFDPDLPVIVDMAAFNPLDSLVIAALLELPLMKEVVERSSCGCIPSDCPRRLAWKAAESPKIRRRIAGTVGLARLVEPEWLFRDVWDFLADLVLEGDCQHDPPTSPWFWRLFYGDSRIARAVRDVADPLRFAMPGIDARLYFADWNSSRIALLDDVEIIPVSQPHGSEERFAYVKAQLAVLTAGHDLASRALRQESGSLARSVMAGATADVLRAINQYMHFGLKAGSGTKLDLVVDHSVRRAMGRAKRGAGLIRLGVAPVEEFRVTYSRVITNHPDNPELRGNKRFLVHVPTNASFELSPERLHLLEEGRSVTLSDRDHVDLAWDLTRYFERVLRTRVDHRELSITSLDFERLSTVTVSYRVDSSAMMIEAAE